MRSRLFAGFGIAALALGLLVATATPVVASPAASAANAVNYARSHGYRSSIGVLDTQTGSFAGAGDYNSTYASESVMKVFIATRLLMTGQMTGWNATTAYKMITQSDDASANALYGRTGGDGVINWVKSALNIPNLGSPPLRSGWWGGTQITAAGMASFYNAVRHRPAVWNWLGNAMHHATRYGSDGTYQYFGIPSATTGAAIKQGWGGDNAAGQPAFNSTGLVNGDRFAVVILTQGGVYGPPIAGMLTSEARLLMCQTYSLPGTPLGGISTASRHSNVATFTGWAFDYDAPDTPLTIVGVIGGRGVTSVVSNTSRPDINEAFHGTDLHGYRIDVPLPAGATKVCLNANNIGPGSTHRLGCADFQVPVSPIGVLDSVAMQGDKALVTGWTFDYDAPTQSIGVVINVGSTHAAWGPTPVDRTDVNQAWDITGKHGFSALVALPPGSSTVCAYGVNVGAGTNTLLGCKTVTSSTAAVAPAGSGSSSSSAASATPSASPSPSVSG